MVCLIPLGGFVRFLTKNEESSVNVKKDESSTKVLLNSQKISFEAASISKRVVTVLAGPLANFIMSAVIFSCVSLLIGKMSTEPIVGAVAEVPLKEQYLQVGDKIISLENQPISNFNEIYEITRRLDRLSDISFQILRNGSLLNVTIPQIFPPIVSQVEMFSPAMKSGIKEGDVFLEVNNQKISSFDELKLIINASIGNSVLVKIWRNEGIFLTNLVPEMRPTETADGNLIEEMRIGIRAGSLFYPQTVSPNIFEATSTGFRMTIYVIRTSLVGLARMLDSTISPKHLSGPIGVAKALSYSASEGFIPFLSLFAAISAGIGLVNLFPIPVLDGGHLMLFLYEGIFKKPAPDRVIKFLMTMGLFILLGLMVFATFNDIVR